MSIQKNISNFIRWTFFIPLGLVCSELIAITFTILIKYLYKNAMPGFFDLSDPWTWFWAQSFIWVNSGSLRVWIFCWISFNIAPRITKFSKWIIVGINFFCAITACILILVTNNDENIRIIETFTQTYWSFEIASWSLRKIKRKFISSGIDGL